MARIFLMILLTALFLAALTLWGLWWVSHKEKQNRRWQDKIFEWWLERKK